MQNAGAYVSHQVGAGPRATVDLSLAAGSCQVHIVVHDSGPPDDEPVPAANRPERRLTVVSGSLGMK
ncbi:hypothetical protein [Streptomyces sp. NPDC058694]|uniref:hypothetical protein n=1 Tax=Streptomyces sp. NPDC058694 TaxID=3346603 RepID=UPI0036605DA8